MLNSNRESNDITQIVLTNGTSKWQIFREFSN